MSEKQRDVQSQDAWREHPANQKEDVTVKDIKGELSSAKTSQVMASAGVFACITMWLYAAQFMPDVYVFNHDDFLHMAQFQEVSLAFYLAAIGLSLVIRNVSVETWLRAGNAVLFISPFWIALYALGISWNFPAGLLTAMELVAHGLLGLVIGLSFTNWIRLYVQIRKSCVMQVGMAFVIAGPACVALSIIPKAAASVLVTVMPWAVLVMLVHLRRSLGEQKEEVFATCTEGNGAIKADRRLWAGLAVIGLGYGLVFGLAVSDVETAHICAVTCMAMILLIGLGILAFFVHFGKNPGYAVSPVVLLATVCMGQALVSIFELKFISVTFALVFAGRMLFESVLLLQLPRVYEKKGSLRTFFALWLVLSSAQLVGILPRHFMFDGFSMELFDYISAALMCVDICVLAMMVKGDSISEVWDLMPMPIQDVPRKRYVSACEAIKRKFRLTPRECEILTMVGRGRNGTFVQEKLVISKSTYQTHMRNLYKKLDVHSDQEVIDLIEAQLDLDKQRELGAQDAEG